MSRLPSLGPRGEGWVAIQLLLFAVVALAGIGARAEWPEPVGAAATLAGWALLVAGGLLAGAGIAGLLRADALTAVPHPTDGARLVDHGAYRLVRHPIYGGLILGAAGWGLVLGSLAALAACVVLFAFLDLKRRREEAWLLERFPQYDAYQGRTRRLIPWLW